MSYYSNPKNLLIIFIQVFFGYLFSFAVILIFLTLVVGWMSDWEINMLSMMLNSIPDKSAASWMEELSIIAITSFFSSLEVKRLGLGWFCYGILLFSRIYYLTSAPEQWLSYSENLRFIWNFALIVHPVAHCFLAGKFVERAFMTPEQESSSYFSEYHRLNSTRKAELRRDGIMNAADYADRYKSK